MLGEVYADGHSNLMVRTRDWKYALDDSGEGFMLYDLSRDPQEQRNLVGHPDHREQEARLRERLLKFLLETQYWPAERAGGTLADTGFGPREDASGLTRPTALSYLGNKRGKRDEAHG